jgi:hypothetical protein
LPPYKVLLAVGKRDMPCAYPVLGAARIGHGVVPSPGP